MAVKIIQPHADPPLPTDRQVWRKKMIRKQSQFKKEKMTMDKLAQMTANGFSEMDKKFDKIDNKFDEMDKKFDKIDKKFDKIDNKFDEMDKKFNKADERFNEVDKRFDRIENSITDLRVEFNDLKSEVNQKIEYGIDRMLTIADQMTSQFLTWKQENAVGASIEARQDEQLQDHEIRIEKLEKV